MPMVYSFSLATAGDLTTSATPATESNAMFLKAGVRNSALKALYVQGKGASLASLTGIIFRLIKFGTASTGGTGITPTPKDPGMQAAKATMASRPSSGSTRVNRITFGCGGAGPGGWAAMDADSVELLEGGGALSLDLMDASGVASMKYEFSGEMQE